MICLTPKIFLRLCSIMGYNRWAIVALVIFLKKKKIFKKKDNLGTIFPKIIQPYISRSFIEFILKYFCMIDHNRLTKSALVSFPQKSSFNTIVQFGYNLSPHHKILCPQQLCLMINALRIFLKFLGMMRHNIDRQK